METHITLEQAKKYFPEEYNEAMNDLRADIDSKLCDEIELLMNQWPDIKALVIEQYGENDEPAVNEAFYNWTDSLCKDGTISEYTYSNATLEDVE
jgi:hypothetical protein